VKADRAGVGGHELVGGEDVTDGRQRSVDIMCADVEVEHGANSVGAGRCIHTPRSWRASTNAAGEMPASRKRTMVASTVDGSMRTSPNLARHRQLG